MAILFTIPDRTAFASNGLPAAGSKLNFYESGTTTAADVYTTPALTTAHSNPVIADSAGRFAPVYLDPTVAYKVEITDSSGTQLGNIVDPYPPLPASDGLPLEAFDTVADAIAAAVAQDTFVRVASDLTVNVPSDIAMLQIPFDRLSPASQQVQITVNIESGHILTTNLHVENGNFSQFEITSDDAEVDLVGSFSNSLYIIRGVNAQMPRLSCLIDASGRGAGGYRADQNSRGMVSPGCGIKNSYGTGLLSHSGSIIAADGSVFTGCAQNGATGSAATAWGAIIYASNANFNDSQFYGGQAAHGGILIADNASADNAVRYGFRATDAGILSVDGARADSCGLTALRAYVGSLVSGSNFVGTNATTYGLLCVSAHCHVSNADFSGAGTNGVQCIQAGVVNIEAGNAQKGASPSASDIVVDDGGIINASGATGGTNITKNTLRGNGIIMDDTADDEFVGLSASNFFSGIRNQFNSFLNIGGGPELTISSGSVTATQSNHPIDTQGNAATDELDTINGGSDGDILIIRPSNSSRTVIAKDSTGNLRLNGDFSMHDLHDRLVLINRSNVVWVELSRSAN